jgi:hypothetical protein
MITDAASCDLISGGFQDLAGERYYSIHNVDQMAPFFISIVSDSDHWLFVSSNGGLTAGRVSPETALFPYITVDKIHDSARHTGCITLIRVSQTGCCAQLWEPFNREHDYRYSVSRHLHKSLLGNKVCFEEINHDLQLAFRYTWMTSDAHGFARFCELENLGDQPRNVEILDGLQNILPANTPRSIQADTSNLVDAYKWTELDQQTGLAFVTLYSGITDRAEPSESLLANTVFCLGLKGHNVLLSSEQINNFRLGMPLSSESRKRGVRGAYLVNQKLIVPPGSPSRWQLVANVEQSQAQAVALRQSLLNPREVDNALRRSIDLGVDRLSRIMASADGFQVAAEQNVTARHYSNVMFNVLRGGIFADQYGVSSRDFLRFIDNFNRQVFAGNWHMLAGLPEQLDHCQLLSVVRETGDLQLERLTQEYLPITFGRRHGDPSRPWNEFAIRLQDDKGDRLLSYEGNWRDIFQNWEALLFSYPEFIESVIAKFVNATTMDGNNPYRITGEGIDWEVEEPDDPWSYIGYWGDHQIIYLQKLLELSSRFHPRLLGEMLHKQIFCYANVPYRIRPFTALCESPKNTVDYDLAVAQQIEQRVADMGADGKLVLAEDGKVLQVNLLEKLLVTLLCKLSNLVLDGGIWLNTQRPEWNDANNALVGQGLSMVTLYHTRRYVSFMARLLAEESGSVSLSVEVKRWLCETAAIMSKTASSLSAAPVGDQLRYAVMADLGEAASQYRSIVYRQQSLSEGAQLPLSNVVSMLDDAICMIDHCIARNLREDGLYNAYNLLELHPESAGVHALYPMLEGQVAVLSSGALSPEAAVSVVESLFDSDVYRADQRSFMLYPDRSLPGFLEKNQLPVDAVEAIPLLQRMQSKCDDRIVLRDADGCYRFNARFTNVADLNVALDALAADYGDELGDARKEIQSLFERVFDHLRFTGRSGGMFGFEGLGCVYWHMVAKLLLAVQENYFMALASAADLSASQRLGSLYYAIRDGLGFNKSPAEFGAFPTDPYSHTPGHAGAQQPGMTGEVKEEILCRFGELGISVSDGALGFDTRLLRGAEFVNEAQQFRFLDVHGHWQELSVPVAALAYSWCQVPIVYLVRDGEEPGVTLSTDDGETRRLTQMTLSKSQSSEIFRRSGHIRQITVNISTDMVFFPE